LNATVFEYVGPVGGGGVVEVDAVSVAAVVDELAGTPGRGAELFADLMS
jgi:flagellar motor switch protein FliM